MQKFILFKINNKLIKIYPAISNFLKIDFSRFIN